MEHLDVWATCIPLQEPSNLCLRCPKAIIDADSLPTCTGIAGMPGKKICQWLCVDDQNRVRPRVIVPVGDWRLPRKGGAA